MLPAAALPGAVPMSLGDPQSVADLVLEEVLMAASSHPAEEASASPPAVSGDFAVDHRRQMSGSTRSAASIVQLHKLISWACRLQSESVSPPNVPDPS